MGGAVCIQNSKIVQIENSQFENNYSETGGGVTIINAKTKVMINKNNFFLNQASFGGGLYMEDLGLDTKI